MSIKKGLKKLLKHIGPGVITGASDDDPSAIATYSQAGARSGLSFLWMSPFTFPLMAAVQEMCARIGLVTGHGLTGTLKRHYPALILYVMATLVIVANTINIGADIAGMAASANLIVDLPPPLLAIIFTGIILAILVLTSYQNLVRYLKWFTLALLAYILVPFIIRVDFLDALKHSFIPSISLDSESVTLLIAILGTNISPYLFFWQASIEVEDKMDKEKRRSLKNWIVTKNEIQFMRKDVTLGMLLSNTVMWFIIVSTAAALHYYGVTNIETAADAARALRPIAGSFAEVLFTLGIVGTGMIAIPVLAGSSSYVISEAFEWKHGLNKQFHQAKGFYLVIIFSTLVGLLMNFLGINPIKALFYTAVLYGLVSPPLILIILHIANNKKVMGPKKNGVLSNILGITTFLVMATAVVLFLKEGI